MSVIRFCVLLASLVLAVGCTTSKPTPSPLAGFSLCFSQDPAKLVKAIQSDYQDYIKRLPPEERKNVALIHTLEDGTGQHAINIEIGINGTWWEHVLIYDKENNRTKVVKYKGG